MKQNLIDQAVENKTVIDDVFSESVRLGFKMGFLLSAIYAAAGVILFIVISITGDIKFSRFDLTELLRLLRPIATMILIIVIVAILPSTLVGGWTGMLIGKIAASGFARKISNVVFILMSMAICSLTAILIHILFKIKIVLPFESPTSYLSLGIFGTYPFLFGIPTIIYVFAGGWFGWAVYSKTVHS